MSSKCFISIVHVSIWPWEFSWNFCDFQSIFRAFKHFLDFSEIIFALKINSKNENSSYPFGPSPWARPEPLRPSRPAGAHLGPALGAARQRRRRQALPWRASRGRRGLVCLFKAPPPPPRTLVAPRTSPCTATACKPPQRPRRSSRTPPLDSPPRVRTERNRRHQEHPLVETNPFRRSPSPETYRTAAAA
jgi:hypothetical protein